MKGIFGLLAACVCHCFAAPDLSQQSCEQLIDSLQEIEAPTAGLHPTAYVGQFLPVDEQPRFEGGILGSAKPIVFPGMRELVRRGPAALPSVLAHLDDPRPTKLVVKEEGHISWGKICNEYNNRPLRGHQTTPYVERYLDFPYQVRVGDVCMVVLGQITNRPQIGVRYQPSGGVRVSSPVVFPEIAREARSDWNDTTPEQLCASLLSDIGESRFEFEEEGAIVRVKFYFPDRLAEAEVLRAKKANQSLEPTPTAVTPRACARVAPAVGVAQH